MPRGAKAWTIVGVTQMAGDAKPIESCDIDELWRGRLHVELQGLEAITKHTQAC